MKKNKNHSHSNHTECSTCQHNHSSILPNKTNVNLKQWLLLGASLVSVVLSFVFYRINLYKGTYLALFDVAWLAIIICGWPIIKEAISAIKQKKINSSVLIAIAIVTSIIMGIFGSIMPNALGKENYFFVTGEIAFLMALGELIEEYTSGKSRASIEKLISLNPTMATLKVDNGYTNINVEDIEVGDIILVRNEEIVPIDGVLLSEIGIINQATLTGEAEPKDIKTGEKVFASSKNMGQPIEIEATKNSSQTVLSQVIDYYKNALEKKAPIVNMADKLATKLVPIALLVALFVFALTAGIYSITEGLARGMAIIVVFCPCALVLATPTALSASIGNASRQGIFIKNGHSLEVLSKIDTIAFDKTGTLTTGELAVDRVISFHMSNEELMFLVASAEQQSEHPIARAILRYYNNSTIPQSTEILAGVGIKAQVQDKIVEVVKLSYAIDKYPQLSSAMQEVKVAKTVLAVIIDNNAEGIITLQDTVKDSSVEALKQLHQDNYETVLLTGDNMAIAKEVSDKLNINEYHYELLPIDKADLINQIQKNGKRVAMVGDGVNDAPAMAVSEVSVSMGNMGSEVAIEASDISLFNDDIAKIPTLLRLSKLSVNTIKINIALSLVINAITVALSAFGLLKAVWGAFLHNVSSVLVSLNSALILTKNINKKHK